MEKVINGKRYNTETAKYICYVNLSPMKYLHLYLKRTGEFFGKYVDVYTGTTKIIMVSNDDAKKYCKEYLNRSEFARLFESNIKRAVNIMIEESLLNKAKQLAVENDISLSEYISLAIEHDTRGL